jgi:hypothetical protein
MEAWLKPPRTTSKQPLEERLAQHPELRTKIESLLSVVENAKGDLRRADEAEQAVIEEIRGIGQAALGEWAEKAQEAARASFLQAHPKAHRSRKKNSTGIVD